jgi:hypothetical protein
LEASIMNLRRALVVASFLAFAPLSQGGGVWNFDHPEHGTFLSLQAAIDAASEGDLLLVKGAQWSSAVIDGKSVSIFAIPPGNEPTLSFVVRNLAPSQVVVLSGLSISNPTGPGLILEGNHGHVRIEGGAIQGGKSGVQPFKVTHPAVTISNCQQVVLAGTSIQGGNPGPQGEDDPVVHGAHGILSVDSTIALVDCVVRGGHGTVGSLPIGGHGGDGLRIQGMAASLLATTLIGGQGGDASYSGCKPGGDGGDGIEALDADLQLLDCVPTQGFGGVSSCGLHGAGGLPIRSQGGSVALLPGEGRILSAVTLASDASALDVTLSGEPGDRVWLVKSDQPGFRVLSGLGTWTVKRPTFVPLSPLGTVPASGVLSASVPLPKLASGDPQQVLFAQAIVLDAQGQGFLSSPRFVGVLSAGTQPDCDGSLVNDFVELIEGTALDCNNNVQIDSCEIAAGTAADCDGNGVPDSCDLAAGLHPDCNGNGVPDACDIASGLALDCNGNGQLDSCDIAQYLSADANKNGIPDECETLNSVTRWVDDDAPPGGNGSPSQPFQRIGDAIAQSAGGDIVIVRDGVYRGVGNKNLEFGGREILLRSENGALGCIIDCEGVGRAFAILGGEGPGLILRGLTIRNGNAEGSTTTYTSGGGGMIVLESVPVIESCVFEDCRARQGAGLEAFASSLRIRNTVFRDCSAQTSSSYTTRGGGVRIVDPIGDSSFVGCKFLSCSAMLGGAIQYEDYDAKSLRLSHCKLLGNQASVEAGALRAQGGLVTIEHSLVANNTSARGGAFLFDHPDSTFVTLRGCTIASNSAAIRGGVFEVDGTSAGYFNQLEIHDSILWGNVAPLGPTLVQTGGSVFVSLASCDVQGAQAGFSLLPSSSFSYGAGNLDLDPRFVDPDGPDNNPLTYEDNDYRLLAGSPCCDAGDNSLVGPDVFDIDGDGDLAEPTPLDLRLHARFVEDPLAPNTGSGTPPLVDLGAYERQP